MKILSEKETTVVDMDCEWEDEEIQILLEYADKNMPEEELVKSKMSWAFAKLIEKHLELENA